MSRRIEFTANYTRPAAEIHRTLTDEGFWRNRVEQGADKGLTLARLTAGEGTIDVALAQDIDKAALPGVVSKILKGEHPANVPIEIPSRYELIVNLRAAKAIGLAMPDSFVLLADEVIE